MAISFYAGSSYQLLQLKRWLIVGFKRRYLKTASLSLTPEMANQMYPYWLLVCYQTYRLLAKNPDIPFLFSWWYRCFVNSNYCCLENCRRSQHFIFSVLQNSLPFIAWVTFDYVLLTLNPSVNMHILITVVHIFLKVSVGRICTDIKTFHAWWSFSLFSWPVCSFKLGYCKEKLDACHYWGLRVNGLQPICLESH